METLQGNYVVQYVLDLNDSRFIEAIVRQFLGNVCALSMQKFSSNVVEKVGGVLSLDVCCHTRLILTIYSASASLIPRAVGRWWKSCLGDNAWKGYYEIACRSLNSPRHPPEPVL